MNRKPERRRTAPCTCNFRTAPWQPHSQRCPKHSDATCQCACHLTNTAKRGHVCGFRG